MAGPLFDLGGRVVVVTGGLGQLGRQFTRALISHNARVIAVDLAEPDSVELSEHTADQFRYYRADVTRRESLEHVLEEVRSEWGQVHGLINNAALDSPPGAPAAENGPFEAYPAESFDRVMEVNTKGVVLCCQVFGGAMAEAGGGSIINISSIYGVVSPDQRIYEYRRQGGEDFFKPVAYSVSKSSLLNLTRYLSTYWADRGVRVNTLTLAGVFNNQDEHFLSGYLARMPMGRMARPDEYNGPVVFLCSDASSYMTGSNLVIDGGWTAW